MLPLDIVIVQIWLLISLLGIDPFCFDIEAMMVFYPLFYVDLGFQCPYMILTYSFSNNSCRSASRGSF